MQKLYFYEIVNRTEQKQKIGWTYSASLRVAIDSQATSMAN
jgi:hypothetical protein